MNICQIIISDGWGGAETVVYELYRHLRDKGENVSIILNEEMVKYYADLKDVKLFNIGPLYPPKYILSNTKMYSDKRNIFAKIINLTDIYSDELIRYRQYKILKNDIKQILEDNRIDVVHSHLPNAALLLANLDIIKVPAIHTMHGDWDLISSNIKISPYMIPFIKLKARRYKNALGKMDKVTAVSNFVTSSIEKWEIKLKSKTIVIYNGINLTDFKNSLMLTKELEGKFNLLYPGGEKRLKGGDLLILALAKLRNNISGFHLYIAGNVSNNDILRQMVMNLGLESNITFVGILPKEEYRRLLNSVDILVMPSRMEAFGIAYIEAMALGKPVIASNTGGIPEVVQDGRNGILVELDSEQIAKAISYLYQHADIREEMGRNNLHDVTKFDWNIITDQYICLYKKCLLQNGIGRSCKQNSPLLQRKFPTFANKLLKAPDPNNISL